MGRHARRFGYQQDFRSERQQVSASWIVQKISFPDVYLNIGDTLTIKILEIYPGKMASTAAITEIVLQGAH
jgi:hypothetical protein